MAYACRYEIPEPENTEMISKLGMEVELKTFKTNASTQTTPEVAILGIVCVGDYCGRSSKHIYIDHYMGLRSEKDLRTIGVDFRCYVKKSTSRDLDAADVNQHCCRDKVIGQRRIMFVIPGEQDRLDDGVIHENNNHCRSRRVLGSIETVITH